MKRIQKALVPILSLSVLFSSVSVFGASGKFLIYDYDWGSFWDEKVVSEQVNETSVDDYDHSNMRDSSELIRLQELIREIRELEKIIKPTPLPEILSSSAPDPKKIITSDKLDNVCSDYLSYNPSQSDEVTNYGYVNVLEQKAVIAWNGRSNQDGLETLILTTEEQLARSGDRESVLLSVLPLPGRPIRIEPADPYSVNKAKALLLSRMPPDLLHWSDIEGRRGPVESYIGSHNIFVWEFDSVETFQRDVQAWIAKKFDGKAAAYINEEMTRVIKFYLDRGFRYFAFDLTQVKGESTKVAIAYTFTSTAVYYPLVISRIGGTHTFSTVDLIIITPGRLISTPASAIQRIFPRVDDRALANDAATLVGGGTVQFSIDEVRSIDKRLDVFDAGTRTLTVRNIRFKKRYNSYVKDFFILSSSGSGVHMEENPPSEPQNPNNDSGASNPKVDDNSKNGNDAASKEKAPQTSTKQPETNKAPEQPQAQNAPAESGEATSQDAQSASQEASAPSEQAPTPANSGSEPTEQQEEQEQPTQ